MIDREEIYKWISEERDFQDNKWGTQNDNTPTDWSAILTEEVGEASKELLGIRFGSEAKRAYYRERARLETIQVAAVAVKMLEALQDGKI